MRLITTTHNQKQAHALSAYLLQKGIENKLEIETNTDWGSSHYGEVSCKLWVYEEDQFKEAMKIAEEFEKNPNQEHFYKTPTEVNASLQVEDKEPIVREARSIGLVTLYSVITCCIMLFISAFTSPQITKLPKGIPYLPVYIAPVYKDYLFDYPKAYEYIDQIVARYGVDALHEPNNLPQDGKELLHKFFITPYWQGIYEKFVDFYKHKVISWNIDAPLFEKEREGQLWRLFTPIFLHYDFLHLLFNMIWLVVLGKQMEMRLGKVKYIIFIAIAALISNTAQYIMSGSSFLGFSGVLCAMLGFIWMRQRLAAWEGYQLEKGTFAFIAFFILFMFGIQLISFFLEAYTETTLPVAIANTAHLAGACVGFILGRLNFFAWRTT